MDQIVMFFWNILFQTFTFAIALGIMGEVLGTVDKKIQKKLGIGACIKAWGKWCVLKPIAFPVRLLIDAVEDKQKSLKSGKKKGGKK